MTERGCPRFLRGSVPQERNHTMHYYLFQCRSLTYAQRIATALERAGITAYVMRSPKGITGEGCSHSVRVSRRNLSDARSVLYQGGLSPERIYVAGEDGSYQEVLL